MNALITGRGLKRYYHRGYETVKALDKLYRTRELREAFAARGRAFVAQDRFRWDHVGASFLREVEETVSIIAG
jgi:hypothetical protein